VWILQSPHSGDNTQLRALGAALGWPAEVKRLVYRGYEGVLRLLGLPVLAGVDLARSSPLTPPWPDLVICSGRGAEAVGFWLKRQNPRLRIVFLGTPWSGLARFDLVITTPQYRLPQAPNVLHNALPLHDVTPEKLAAEAARCGDALRHLPRPLTAVLVGGSSGPYLFTPDAATTLARVASRLAAARGGALLVTTSARTGQAAADALAAGLSVPHVLYRWQGPVADNPFHAFLGLSDEILVTADSVSMLAEACASGRPVHLFDIEDGRFAMRAEHGDGQALPPIGWRGRTLETTLFRFLINHLPARFSRDLRIFHRQLTASGMAAWLPDDEVPAPRQPRAAGPNAELAASVARIRGLFGL
jgi:mitochondrial fission protein ELM1